MYTAIEYEINYIAESFQYVSDKSGFIKMHLNTYSIIHSKNTNNFYKSFPNIFISKRN